MKWIFDKKRGPWLSYSSFACTWSPPQARELFFRIIAEEIRRGWRGPPCPTRGLIRNDRRICTLDSVREREGGGERGTIHSILLFRFLRFLFEQRRISRLWRGGNKFCQFPLVVVEYWNESKRCGNVYHDGRRKRRKREGREKEGSEQTEKPR